MTTHFSRNVPSSAFEHGRWRDLTLGTNGGAMTAGLRHNKLLFSDAAPASVYNRATLVGRPAPIMIVKLLPVPGGQEEVDDTRSVVSFSTLSEERMAAAITLAKRDVRRRRLESLNNSPAKSLLEDTPLYTTDEDLEATCTTKLKVSSPKGKVARPGARKLVPSLPTVAHDHSPPTRDPGPRPLFRGHQLSQEIRKLQNQLEVYIQKIETLPNRVVKTEEPVDSDEENMVEILRQKQAARSARMLYVLQQQVKEIEAEIEKQRGQKMLETKKPGVMHRLAAAHRGAIRAMQVFIHQLSELSTGKLPAHYRALGELVRQLALCAAKVEVDQGSTIPEATLNILQRVVILDSVLSKQEMLEQKQAQACSSPPHRRMSPPRAPRGPTSSTSLRGPRRAAGPKRGIHSRRMASHKPRAPSAPSADRSAALKAGLEDLIQQRELKERLRESRLNNYRRRGGALHPERSKAGMIMKCNRMQDGGFQQPTVSSRLRVNQLPQKEPSVPWMPTSPHSSPPQRSAPRSRQEPRCLFSPAQPRTSSPKQKGSAESAAEPTLNPDKKTQAQSEALREAWLEKMTMQRLRELDQLSKDEAERIQRLRCGEMSTTRWAERAEQEARERIQPLIDEVQISASRNRDGSSVRGGLSEQTAERAAESAEQLSEALLEDLLEDTAQAAWAVKADKRMEGLAQRGLQAPSLEGMLLRMEEIQRDEDEVRRRFATIAYSDLLYSRRPGPAGPQCQAPGSRPASPQPIRLTKPVLKPSSAADIVLEKPVETGVLSESSLSQEASHDEQQPRKAGVFPGPAERSRGTVIAVPGRTLRSIRSYRDDYDAHLRLVAHEATGSFDPWAIADSLAENLLSEALADVAAEFQDAVEEYAEAVFTSEFLQPIQSPPATAALGVGQPVGT
ncbi:protein moonraker isoform X2 [Genypterus blacodes]|uniref:protein moonraker isoform X2 n=1 Tax=Genypterus blacodes TaxID=154954 RepID=UPI003F7719FE